MHEIVEHGCESQFSRSDLKAMLQPTPRRSLPSSSARGSEGGRRRLENSFTAAVKHGRLRGTRSERRRREGGGRIREEREGGRKRLWRRKEEEEEEEK